MKMTRPLLFLALCFGSLAGVVGLGSAAEPIGKAVTAGETGEQLVFHTDWKGERIALPRPSPRR